MNIVLRKPGSDEYYVVYTQPSIRGGFLCGAKMVRSESNALHCEQFPCGDERSAIKRCRSRAKAKINKRGYSKVLFDDIPTWLFFWMQAPPEMQVSADELATMAREAVKERYVIFNDVAGLEAFFDIEVEYLASELEDGFLSVYDRFGERRGCFVERMASVVPTERSREIERVFSG